MNELEHVRSFRAEAPTTTPAAPRNAFMEEVRPRRRSTSRWLYSAAALAIGASGLFALQSGPGAAPSEASVVLQRAAAVVGANDVPRPSPRQWFYISHHGKEYGEEFDPDPALAGHGWVRFDEKKYVEPSSDDLDGDLTPGTIDQEVLADYFLKSEAWDAAAALPSEPEALLSALRDSELADPQGATEAAKDFDAVRDTFERQWPLPAQAQANLYSALATIPGVGVERGAEPDLLGRPVLAVTFDGESTDSSIRSRRELLLDPVTYAFLGTRETALEAGEDERGATVEPGDTRSHVRVGPVAVDRPGQRQ